MPRNWFWRLWAIWIISLEPASAVSVVNGTLGGSMSFHQFVYWNAPLEWRFGVFGDDEVVAVRPFYGVPYCYPRFQGRCQLSIEGALQLNNLTYTDQGQYVFIVGAIEPYRSQIVYYQLQIYSPLSVPVLILNAAHNRLVSGSNGTFYCDGGNQNITTYIFYRDGKKICSEPHVTCRDSYLYIQPITGSDSGRYTCTIHNPVSSNISNVLLVTVSATLTAPALVPNSAPGHPFNGSYASFHCDAGEQLVDTYTFYRDGKNICSEPHVTCRDSYLYFQTLSKHDSGRYTCTIQNTAGTSTSNILQLSVSAPTSAAVLTSNHTGLVWEGESVSFNCSTQLTSANFTWNVNGSALPGGSHYYIILDPKGQSTTLTISPVSTNDMGSYTCEARNTTTTNETSDALTLNVGIAPTNTSIYCGSEAYAGGVVLICSWAGGQPAADIQLSFNGTVTNEKDAVNLNVLLSNEVQQPELVCQGNQTGRISECKTTFERPASSSHDNNAINSAIEGQSATLNVSLTSQSSLISEFTWFSPNLSPVNTSDGKYKVETIGSQSILFISNLTVSDNGTYTCTARNVIGSTTFNFTLDVKSQGSNDSGGSSGSSGLSGGAIAGIVIGVLAGVALIGVGGYFLVKKVF